MSIMVLANLITWFASMLSQITIDLEQLALEFVLLGRIPGTNFFMPFEFILTISIIGGLAALISFMPKDPNPAPRKRLFS